MLLSQQSCAFVGTRHNHAECLELLKPGSRTKRVDFGASGEVSRFGVGPSAIVAQSGVNCQAIFLTSAKFLTWYCFSVILLLRIKK